MKSGLAPNIKPVQGRNDCKCSNYVELMHLLLNRKQFNHVNLRAMMHEYITIAHERKLAIPYFQFSNYILVVCHTKVAHSE